MIRSIIPLCVLWNIAAAPLPCPVIPAGQTWVASVHSIKGDWRLKGQPDVRLSEGCKLPPGDEINPPASRPDGYVKIAIVDRSGTNRVKACKEGQDCGGPLVLGNVKQDPPGILPSLIEEVMAQFRRQAGKFVTAGGMGDGMPRDAIVRHSAGSIDLAPALQSVDGAAVVTLQHQAPIGAKPGPRLLPQSGLYTLHVEGQSRPAWVLVLGSEPEAEKILSDEKAVVNMLGNWRDDADTEERNARRTVYRAFLQAAADRLNAH